MACDCYTAAVTHIVTAAPGASIGGHMHWMTPKVDLCLPGASLRVHGSWTVAPNPGYPWDESGTLEIHLNDLDGDGTGSGNGSTVLHPGFAWGVGGTGTFDKCWGYNAGSNVHGWVDTSIIGTGGWAYGDLEHAHVGWGAPTQYRIARNGQWAPQCDGVVNVEWIDIVSGGPCLPPGESIPPDVVVPAFPYIRGTTWIETHPDEE